MTAASHTLYSLTLFLALVSLNLWTGRRHRIPLLVLASVASTTPARDVAHELPHSVQ
jgi:hypothetical protein